jgi:hypothetical protein
MASKTVVIQKGKKVFKNPKLWNMKTLEKQ